MVFRRIQMIIGIVAVSALGGPARSAAPGPEKGSAAYQKSLDNSPWSWEEHESSIFYSMSQSAFAYQIELIRPPGKTDELKIRFVKDGRVCCSWAGHRRSVFRQTGSTLVYALYHPSEHGCTLVAVNLDTGAELWRTKLKGVHDGAHSGYQNAVTLSGTADVLLVKGKESFGNYNEIVDVKTGRTIAHRVYDKDANADPKE